MKEKKIIIITGASSGIGFVSAKYLAQKGHIVYGFARRLEAMEPLKEFGVTTKKLDVQNNIEAKKLFAEIFKNHKRIDVLINNAGYDQYGAIEDVSTENIRKQMEVNLIAPAELSKLVIPIMRKQKSGKIINISSMGGKVTFPLGGWYHASKYALEAISDAMRMELKRDNISVVLIEPGAIKTEFGDVVSQTAKDIPKNSNFKQEYKKQLEASANLAKHSSDPIVIAKVINKAIKKKNPKARYVKGKMAKLILRLKRYTTTKFLDRLLIKMSNLK